MNNKQERTPCSSHCAPALPALCTHRLWHWQRMATGGFWSSAAESREVWGSRKLRLDFQLRGGQCPNPPSGPWAWRLSDTAATSAKPAPRAARVRGVLPSDFLPEPCRGLALGPQTQPRPLLPGPHLHQGNSCPVTRAPSRDHPPPHSCFRPAARLTGGAPRSEQEPPQPCSLASLLPAARPPRGSPVL